MTVKPCVWALAGAAGTHGTKTDLFPLFVAWPKPYQVQLLRGGNGHRSGVSLYEFGPALADVTSEKSRERMQREKRPRKEGDEAVFRAAEVLKIKQERCKKRWYQMVYVRRTLKEVFNWKGGFDLLSLYQGKLSLASIA